MTPKEKIIDYLADHPGRTYYEIASDTGVDPATVEEEINGLRSEGVVVKVDNRRCIESGLVAPVFELHDTAPQPHPEPIES